MNLLRIKLAMKRLGRGGYRGLRRGLRSALPSRLRRLIVSAIDSHASEKPASGFSFAPPGGFDVVCFPIIDWDSRFQRPQQLLSQFARDGHRVFYVHTTFHQESASPLVRKIAENIYRVRLPGPPGLHEVYRGEINGRKLEQFLTALGDLRHLAGIGDCVSIVQYPYWADLALTARERWGWRAIYDCMDELSGFAQANAATLRQEKALLSQSDMVVATSRVLYEKARPLARNALLLPNGADYEHFSRPGASHPLAGLRGPIIGYYGAIAEWFDVEMIRDAAQARPDWQFVLIGEVTNPAANALKRLPNVLLLGEIPYRELPDFLRHFDVACIPFLKTPLTEATDPVKFYEYLSAGKPVVSVLLPELEPYQDYFYPVRTREDFMPQIEAALREESAERVEARKAFARNHTWVERYRRLREKLREWEIIEPSAR